MDNQDREFKKLREKFADDHRRRTRSLEAHMNEAKRLVESGLAAKGVHHTPISHRLKDQEKALRTLNRRQEARKELQSLKTMVQERGSETWEQYCRIWNMEDKIQEAEPFNSVGQMFEDMHDLAGIRVSLYFPDDVQKVVDLLQHRFKVVEGPKRKGGLTRDFQKIRKLVEEQRRGQETNKEEQGDLGSLETTSLSPESPFGGYRATHVVIQHKDRDFDKHALGDDPTNIEVQIGSIIMHAWSDIEHDILYKPSHTGTASPDVIRMLGLINGIIMTGEVALQQLASISAAESIRNVEDRTQKATGSQYMTPWLDKYFTDNKRTLPSNLSWMSTGILFDILKATDEHHYGKLEELLDGMNPKPVNRLPVLVLHYLGRDTYPFRDNIPPGKDPIFIPAWSARYWATCLVNVLNLAAYMDWKPNMLDAMLESAEKDRSLPYPTFADFLDILHPTKPKHRPNHDGYIIKFCRAMLDKTFDLESHGLAVMKLVSAGYVARPRISQKEELVFGSNGPPIIVPARLNRMRSDSLSTFRIMLSMIDENLRSEDKYLYFIPCLTGDGANICAWKPVLRQSGRWSIVHAPFSYDTPDQFETDNIDDYSEIRHMRRTLGIKMEAEDIRGLRSLAKSLKVDQDQDQLRLIVKLTRILDTANIGKIQKFKELLGSEKIKGDDEMTMLAELNRSKEIKDHDDLKQWLQLSRSVRTTDTIELSAYRQLERNHGTRDIESLKKLRNAQKDAERAGSQADSGLGDDLADREDALADDKSTTSVESSDDEN